MSYSAGSLEEQSQGDVEMASSDDSQDDSQEQKPRITKSTQNQRDAWLNEYYLEQDLAADAEADGEGSSSMNGVCSGAVDVGSSNNNALTGVWTTGAGKPLTGTVSITRTIRTPYNDRSINIASAMMWCVNDDVKRDVEEVCRGIFTLQVPAGLNPVTTT